MALLSPLDRDLDAWLPHGHPLDGKVREWLGAMRDKLADLDAGVLPGTVNAKDYGARGKKDTSTGNMTAGSATITGTEASKFPVGTWLAIDGAGAKSTTGSITAASQDLTVADPTGFETGVCVRVAGAGIGGVDFYTEVCRVAGSVVTVDIVAGTTVAGAAVDLIEANSLPAKLIGRVVSHPSASSVILDRVALSSVGGAAVSTDNSRAFTAAIDAMNSAVTYPANFASRHGSVLYIPPGDLDATNGWGSYMCHRTIRITRHLVMTGDVPNGAVGTEPTVVLEFAPGIRAGLMIEGGSDVKTSGGNGAGATIRNIRANGGATFENPVQPSLFGQTHPATWHPATAYAKGVVRIPTVGRTNDFGRVLVCVQAGTTAGADVNDVNAEPNWDANSFLGRVITDGTAKWLITNNNFIEVLASCQIDNCMAFGFSGLSLQWAASSPSIANLGTVINMQSWFCGAGPLIIGQDANQVNFIGGNSFGCYGYGLVDQSFLGNSYMGFHTQDNLRGCYLILNSTFFNCYAEGAQGPIILGTNAKWVDGTRGAAAMDGFNDSGPGARGPYWSPGLVVAGNTCIYPTVDNGYFYWTQSGGTCGGVEPTWPLGRGRRIAGDGTVAWFCGGPSAYHTQSIYQVGALSSPRQYQRHDGTDLIETWTGGRNFHNDTFQTFIDHSAGNWVTQGWDLKNKTSGVGSIGFVRSRRNASSGYGGRPWVVLDSRHANAAFDGQLLFPDGFVVGDRSQSQSEFGTTVRAGRMIGFLDAIPTSGTFIRNDWFHFHNPTAAGWVGAVCVTAGTPGTWKRFGAIEA
jgi:hypothetical protein